MRIHLGSEVKGVKGADGLLEWLDMEAGTRLAIVQVGGRIGTMAIKSFDGTGLVELVLVLGSVTGADQTDALEEIAQSWMERIGGEPG
jgi:hypothetical protein